MIWAHGDVGEGVGGGGGGGSWAEWWKTLSTVPASWSAFPFEGGEIKFISPLPILYINRSDYILFYIPVSVLWMGGIIRYGYFFLFLVGHMLRPLI